MNKLRAELASFHTRQRDNLQLMHSQELMFINDINVECKRIANALGTTPRIVMNGLESV
jgi:hypothetical protein